jgi:hypothetical protein
MIALIVIAALALTGLAASALSLPRDGYRRVPTDRLRLP